MELINQTTEEITKWIERDVTTLLDLSPDSKQLLYCGVLDKISINTERMKELRLLKVKMHISLEKLMKIVEEPWQKSKYSFAIISIKSRLHEINRCINDALELNGKLVLFAAACNDAANNYSLANLVDLTYQENCVRKFFETESDKLTYAVYCTKRGNVA